MSRQAIDRMHDIVELLEQQGVKSVHKEVLAALIISTAIGDLVQAIQHNTSAVHAVAESMHRG